MNLFEMLENYKRTPYDEVRKINDILERKVYVDYENISLLDVFEQIFLKSQFIAYESNFKSFLDNFIFTSEYGIRFVGLDEAIIEYRLFCELLLNLIKIKNCINYIDKFGSDIKQLQMIIENGINNTGYKIIEQNGNIVTAKKDEIAESVAIKNEKYRNTIYDYLIAKNVKEKENALTKLAIKLEAIKSTDSYIKANREYIQILRHKEEKIIDEKYSWFFEDSEYENNLDKLFKIYISTIAYLNCTNDIKTFKMKTNDVKIEGGKK